MKKKITLLAIMFFALAPATFAQGPNGSGAYYKNADGKTSGALRSALGTIISTNANDVGYDGLKESYKVTDKRPDGKLRDWYSDITNYTWNDFGGNSSEGAGWNREHLVPQSWFGSGKPKSDLIQVVPTDCWVNGMRSNLVLAEVSNITNKSKTGYSKKGSCKTSGYNGTVFEPNDEIKGDIARVYFYMATRYESLSSGWGNSVFDTKNKGCFEKWAVDMLIRWSKLDPVDDVEIARNNGVWSEQKNRNPFVDYPGLEDYIWGSKVGQPFSYDNYEGGGGDIVTVAMPKISPDEGTYYDEVVVSITTSTDGATIYYTTDNSSPTENSTVYEGTFTLTESATVKAIAVKDGVSSCTASATYTVTQGSGGEADDPTNCSIALNNVFFNCSYDGPMGTNGGDLIGTQNGITVAYSLGSGSNRYCNDKQIRLYQENKLTVSVGKGTLTKIVFVVDKETSKKLSASIGTVNGFTWTGDASSVTFHVDNGSGNMQISSLKVNVSGGDDDDPGDVSAIRQPHAITTPQSGNQVVYNLKGQRVTNPGHGIYIVNGRKVVLP